MAVNSATRTERVSAPRLTQAGYNLEIAKNLKYEFPSLTENLKVAKKAPVPVPGVDGAWQAPNGNPLFQVVLGPVSLLHTDAPTRSALVDPKTDSFYFVDEGGMPGPSAEVERNFWGPIKLRSKFEGKKFDMDALAVAARQPAGPTEEEANKVFANRSFNWSGEKPSVADIEKSVDLGNGYVNAHVLRSNPNYLVFEKSNDTWVSQFSTPVNWRKQYSPAELKKALKQLEGPLLAVGGTVTVGPNRLNISISNPRAEAKIHAVMDERASFIPYKIIVSGPVE